MSLPRGWAKPCLAEVCEFNPKHSSDIDRTQTVSFVPMPAVSEHSGAIETPADRPLSEIWKGYTHFADNDVIFAKITPCMENGKAAIARNLTNGLACGSTEFHVLRTKGAVLSDYLWRFMRQEVFRRDAEAHMSGAVGQRRVPKPYLEAHPIPLPPLPEQQRIVRKLDTLSARSTTARTHLNVIEKLVERYKLAVLRGAFFVDASGTLREEEADALGWDIRPLGRSLENLDNRRIPIKAEDRKKRQGPYDYYGASGVIDKIDEYLFDGRYLLIGEDGANLVARSSPIAFIAEGQFWVNNHAHILGETPYACLDWVRLYFAAIKLEPFVTGSAQPKLTQANLNKIPVPLPQPDEQRKIVHRIETAFAKIDRLTAEAKKGLKLLGHLDQRILAKAFAGELVPQDPNDEPAETLLARIREARSATPKSKRRRTL